MRDLIVATGCSFTNEKFRATSVPEDFPEHLRGGWKMWPEVFKDNLSKADNYKYELINTAESGVGLEYAFDSLIELFHANKDRLKVMLWGGTDWLRVPHFTRRKHGWGNIRYFQDDANVHIPKEWEKKDNIQKEAQLNIHVNNTSPWQKLDNGKVKVKLAEELKKYSDDFVQKIKSQENFGPYLLEVARDLKNTAILHHIAKRCMNRILTLKELCEKEGITFIYMTLLPPLYTGAPMTNIDGIDYAINQEKEIKIMSDACIESFKKMCDSKNIWGFDNKSLRVGIRPWSQFNMHNLISSNKEHFNWDGHPNEQGQKKLGNQVFDLYNEIVNGDESFSINQSSLKRKWKMSKVFGKK